MKQKKLLKFDECDFTEDCFTGSCYRTTGYFSVPAAFPAGYDSLVITEFQVKVNEDAVIGEIFELDLNNFAFADGDYYEITDIGVFNEKTLKICDHVCNVHDNWIVTKEPEVGVAGEEKLYCTVCGAEIDSREIPALQVYFKAAEGTTTVVDKENSFIYGLEEGIYDLNGFVEYQDGVVEYVEGKNGFGTGTVVNFVVDGEVYESYTIIIFGDLTGDGVVDTFDAANLASIVNGDIELEEGSAVDFAGDIAWNDDWIDTYDLATMYAAVNGDISISQVI